MERALVTGGCGFVGSWMCEKLLREGHEVHVFDKQVSDTSLIRNSCGDKASLVKLHEGDIADVDAVLNAIKEVDVIFHLAGVIEYDAKKRGLMEHVNVKGTAALLQAMEKSKQAGHPVRRLVQMSSIAAIGFSDDGKHLATEADQYSVGKYNLGYFETKHKGEVLIMNAVKQGLVDAVVVNPTTIYGPGDAYKASRGQQVKTAKGKNKFYTGGGVNVVHVHDATDAIYRAYKMGKTGERYIVAGDNITIKQLVCTIAEAAKVRPPRWYVPNWLILTLGFFNIMLTYERAIVTTKFHWADNSKIKRELGASFRPARDALHDSVAWMRKNGIIGAPSAQAKTD